MIYLDGVPVNPTVFPDNTSQVWKLERDGKLAAETAGSYEDDLMEVVFWNSHAAAAEFDEIRKRLNDA